MTDSLFEPILQRSKASRQWRTPSYPDLGVLISLSTVLADRVRRAAVSWPLHPWLNTPTETKRLEAARAAMGNWKSYSHACQARHNAHRLRLSHR